MNEPSTPPLLAWVAALLICVILLVVAILDYLDGPESAPSTYLLATLATALGLVLGRSLPFSGGGRK